MFDKFLLFAVIGNATVRVYMCLYSLLVFHDRHQSLVILCLDGLCHLGSGWCVHPLPVGGLGSVWPRPLRFKLWIDINGPGEHLFVEIQSNVSCSVGRAMDL